MLKHLTEIWKKPKENLGDVWKNRLIKLRTEGTVVRVDKPTRPDRAKRLGYKAKQGFVVVRAKVPKGTRKRPKVAGGRRPKTAGRFFPPDKSKQQMAEEKASRKYPNMEVLNSYYLTEDGRHKWYEIILADTSHPAVKKDKERKWVASGKHKGRANRGLTSSAKKSRREK
ncbi:MAG: 50S ribosomal protein L15e [Candidatus Aenigmarchaeota archaeon]|nr:50S ribosomal protein L15e [Candidatus Aenigmarchaeota archaeon]